MEENIRIRFLLQMAAVLHLGVRPGEQCELAAASQAILARHSCKGHALAALQGSLGSSQPTSRQRSAPCQPSRQHSSLAQAGTALEPSAT